MVSFIVTFYMFVYCLWIIFTSPSSLVPLTVRLVAFLFSTAA